MEKELWERSQMLVDAGMGHIVKHLYVAELEEILTKQQVEEFGDISEFVDRAIASKGNMKDLIESLPYLFQHGIKFSPKK